MPHCTTDYAWYLGKFIFGFAGMLFLYVGFLKETEPKCLCLARMREFMRRKGENTNSLPADHRIGVNARTGCVPKDTHADVNDRSQLRAQRRKLQSREENQNVLRSVTAAARKENLRTKRDNVIVSAGSTDITYQINFPESTESLKSEGRRREFCGHCRCWCDHRPVLRSRGKNIRRKSLSGVHLSKGTLAKLPDVQNDISTLVSSFQGSKKELLPCEETQTDPMEALDDEQETFTPTRLTEGQEVSEDSLPFNTERSQEIPHGGEEDEMIGPQIQAEYNEECYCCSYCKESRMKKVESSRSINSRRKIQAKNDDYLGYPSDDFQTIRSVPKYSKHRWINAEQLPRTTLGNKRTFMTSNPGGKVYATAGRPVQLFNDFRPINLPERQKNNLSQSSELCENCLRDHFLQSRVRNSSVFRKPTPTFTKKTFRQSSWLEKSAVRSLSCPRKLSPVKRNLSTGKTGSYVQQNGGYVVENSNDEMKSESETGWESNLDSPIRRRVRLKPIRTQVFDTNSNFEIERGGGSNRRSGNDPSCSSADQSLCDQCQSLLTTSRTCTDDDDKSITTRTEKSVSCDSVLEKSQMKPSSTWTEEDERPVNSNRVNYRPATTQNIRNRVKWSEVQGEKRRRNFGRQEDVPCYCEVYDQPQSKVQFRPQSRRKFFLT